MPSIVREYRNTPFNVGNGLNNVFDWTVTETGIWVLEGGVHIFPASGSVGNNLTEFHVCVSDNTSLQGPPCGGPDADHVYYINGQGQVKNTGMSIMELTAGHVIHVLANLTYNAGQMQGQSWLVGHKL